MPRLHERAKSLVSQVTDAREAIVEASVDETVEKETVGKEIVEKETATDENRIEKVDLPDPCEPPKQTN